MIETVPFKHWHYAWLNAAGPAIDGIGTHPGTAVLRELEKQNSATLVVDGTPVVCGGTILQWPGRSIGWAYFNMQSAPHMTAATRATKRVLRRAVGRIDCTVRSDFAQGHRWAKLLGFEIETPLLRAYGPEGEDHVGYVMFSKGE